MSKTIQQPFVYTYAYYDRIQRYFNGSVTEDNHMIPNTQAFTGSRIYGDNYPDWKYRLAHHIQCTTNLTVDVVEGKAGKFLYSAQYSPLTPGAAGLIQFDTIRGVGSYFAPTYSSGISLTDADNLAKSRYLASIRRTRNQFQGGVFIGEIKETLHMIRHPAESLINGLRHYLGLVKKRTRGARSIPKRSRLRVLSRIVSDTWLENAFGLQPLISDISDAVKAFERTAQEFDGANVHGTGVSERQYSFKGTDNVGGPALYRYVDYVYERYIVVYRGYVMASLGSSHRNAALFGLSLESLAPTIWELVPWSFLSDYFVNLDDIIESATTSTTGLRWTSRTEIKELSAKRLHSFDLDLWMQSFNPSPTRSVVVHASHEPSYFHRKRIARAPYIGSLVPSLSWKFHQSDMHLANIAALLLGQASGLSRGLRSLI